MARLDAQRVDVLAAGLLLTAAQLQVWLTAPASGRAAGALGGTTAIAVALRRRWPGGAVAIAVAGLLAADLLGAPLGQRALATIPAGLMVTYGIGAFLPIRRALPVLGFALAALALDVALTSRAADDLFFNVVVVGLMPWGVGVMRRTQGLAEDTHRELAERLDAEREVRARTATLNERARVARELHDVIAHSVSVMVIQAGGARMVMDADPARAEESLRMVERAGRDALAEMRRLVGALDAAAARRPLAPSPSLAQIPDLISRARAAGLDADLAIEGEPCPVSQALGLCAYRIVQEGLTNAIKHAGPARVTVRVIWTAQALELEVDDTGGPAVQPAGAHGHGLAGMHERAAMHGGRVQAGPRPGGGFAVHAHLPLDRELVA